ncbi:MAG TPA: hypothetical protein PLX66_01410 [Bacilli bacterium]|nr:hypothetical protein [Bacilli bacterium]
MRLSESYKPKGRPNDSDMRRNYKKGQKFKVPDKHLLPEVKKGTEITDDMFKKQTYGAAEDAIAIEILPPDCHGEILNIMTNSGESTREDIIQRMLDVPMRHKDIQFLENLGIKKGVLSTLFYRCCSEDINVFDVTLFIFKNHFFNSEEIIANLTSDTPIPFYNPEIKIDGLSVENKSKLTNIPSEIISQGKDAIISYCVQRFESLKAAIRSDYFSRKAAINKENMSKRLSN